MKMQIERKSSNNNNNDGQTEVAAGRGSTVELTGSHRFVTHFDNVDSDDIY